MNSVARECKTCGQAKPLSDFYVKSKTKNGKTRPTPCYETECKTCCRITKARRNARYTGRDYKPKQGSECKKCGARTGSTKVHLCVACKQEQVNIKRAVRAFLGLAVLVKECLTENPKCVECGKRTGSHRRRYCCDNCTWRANRRRRRARNRNAYDEAVDLNEIAERDGWRCQLCGKKVARNATYKKQATIDHIVPLSKGGRHSPANTQLAHFDCNSRKKNKMGGQLRLC